MKNILILCTGNSCRSQIAEGYFKAFLANKATVFSAGVETHGVNPRAIETMHADGIDISMHTSNHIDEYAAIPFDLILTVCDSAKERCPYLPSNAKRIHHNFTDPAKANGTEFEIQNEFNRVRDLIKSYIQDLIQTQNL